MPSVAQPAPMQIAMDAGAGLSPALDIDAMGSISSSTQVTPPLAPAAAAAGKTGADSPSESGPELEPILPFDLSQHRSASSALLDYARWHNRTVADARACKETGVLVWSAAAVRHTHTRAPRCVGATSSRAGFICDTNPSRSLFALSHTRVVSRVFRLFRIVRASVTV